jgi:hypothetical protein
MFDHVSPTVFWPLLMLGWLLVSIVVGTFIGKMIRWCDTPQNRYVDSVDVKRCERTGSQAEFNRRLNSRGLKSRVAK